MEESVEDILERELPAAIEAWLNDPKAKERDDRLRMESAQFAHDLIESNQYMWQKLGLDNAIIYG